MAAAKVAALHSAYRSVPRDVFDLNDLIAHGADPIPVLSKRAKPDWLQAISGRALERTSALGWGRANEELLPYLPRSVRAHIDAESWKDMCLQVAAAVDTWVKEAQ